MEVCNNFGNKKSLLILSIDALRFDYVTEQHCPNIFNFFKNNHRFLSHHSTSPSTIMTLLAANSSADLSEYTGVRAYEDSTKIDVINPLGGELDKRGIITFLSAPNIMIYSYLPNLFKSFKSNSTLSNMNTRTPTHLQAQETFQWIHDNKDEPFFAWMHIIDLHRVCRNIDCELENADPSLINLLRSAGGDGHYKITNQYLAVLKYIDRIIGNLLQWIEREMPWLDVAIFSDHGEHLGERYKMSVYSPDVVSLKINKMVNIRKPSNKTQIYHHGYTLYTNMIHVPFAWKSSYPKTTSANTCTQDLYPTIFEHCTGERSGHQHGIYIFDEAGINSREYISMRTRFPNQPWGCLGIVKKNKERTIIRIDRTESQLWCSSYEFYLGSDDTEKHNNPSLATISDINKMILKEAAISKLSPILLKDGTR